MGKKKLISIILAFSVFATMLGAYGHLSVRAENATAIAEALTEGSDSEAVAETAVEATAEAVAEGTEATAEAVAEGTEAAAEAVAEGSEAAVEVVAEETEAVTEAVAEAAVEATTEAVEEGADAVEAATQDVQSATAEGAEGIQAAVEALTAVAAGGVEAAAAVAAEGADAAMQVLQEGADAAAAAVAEGADAAAQVLQQGAEAAATIVEAGAEMVMEAGVTAEPAEEGEPEEEGHKDLVILFTSDIHCGIEQGFGFIGLEQIKEQYKAQGYNVVLVDDGDAIQGEPIGTMTKGEAMIDLMNAIGYDVAIPGNHEFDYGMDTFLELTEKAEFPYISCNFNKEGELIFEPYTIKDFGDYQVGFVGVTTPATLTSSTPKYFQDENGKFIYGFLQDKTGKGVYDAVQKAVDDARDEGADYVVVMGHVGNEEICRPYTYADIIENTTGIDVFLDGHSHDTDQVVMLNKDGEEVIRSACGTKMAGIGWVKFTEDGITNGLYTWSNSISPDDLFGFDNVMTQYVEDEKAEFEDKLTEVVAHTDILLTINDPVALDTNGTPVRMVRRAETNLGNLCADAYLDQSGADIALVNGGGIRKNIAQGDVTLNDILSVHPFGNMMTVVEATGQQILDALEWGARAVPGENGGFLQPAGITYEIHTYIDSPCEQDEDSMYVGINGERRVKNVLVGGEPIDPEATYSVASVDYILLNHGDGYTMFDGCEVLQDSVKLDNQVLIDYISGTLEGEINTGYEELTGEGRIVIVDEAPAE